MSISPTYLLNVSLHAAILSVFASLILLALRQARHRSVAAIVGLLAVGFLPWLTALRPAQPMIAPVPEIQTQAPILPTWTVATVSAPTEIPTPTEPVAPPAKFVFPAPLPILATLWATGAGISLMLLGVAALKVRHWRKSLVSLDDSAWQTLQSLAPEIPARHRFLLSETTASPCVTGFFRPCIVLPRFLFNAGSEEGLRWAVRHEAAHWQAGDSRWMILFALIRSANWWNPLVHRLVTKWADAREQLCDLQATGLSETRADYGEFLIAMARKITRPPPLTVAMAQRSHAVRLKRRIVLLLEANADSARPVGKSLIWIGCFVFILLAVLVTSVRIGAEEAVSRKEALPASTQAQQLKVWVERTMVFSKKALGPKDGEVLKAGELAKLLENAKKEGCVTVPYEWSQTIGKIHSLELAQNMIPGPDSGISSQWRESQPQDPPGNGISFETTVNCEEKLTNIGIRSLYRYVPGSAYPVSLSTPESFGEGTQFEFKRAAASAGLKFGEALSLNFGEVDPGVFLQVFTTAVPLAADGSGTSFNTKTRFPSAAVKGRVRISGMKISADADEVKSALEKFPVESVFRKDDDGLTYTFPQVLESWQYILGSKIQTLPLVEFPLNEAHSPWLNVPGFAISITASADYQNVGISGKPAKDAVDQKEQKVPLIGKDLPLSFKIRNADPKMASRVFFKIEVLK
jgi:beta-lactamase regulating signal transducer with metallopeptidase domain